MTTITYTHTNGRDQGKVHAVMKCALFGYQRIIFEASHHDRACLDFMMHLPTSYTEQARVRGCLGGDRNASATCRVEHFDFFGDAIIHERVENDRKPKRNKKLIHGKSVKGGTTLKKSEEAHLHKSPRVSRLIRNQPTPASSIPV